MISAPVKQPLIVVEAGLGEKSLIRRDTSGVKTRITTSFVMSQVGNPRNSGLRGLQSPSRSSTGFDMKAQKDQIVNLELPRSGYSQHRLC